MNIVLDKLPHHIPSKGLVVVSKSAAVEWWCGVYFKSDFHWVLKAILRYQSFHGRTNEQTNVPYLRSTSLSRRYRQRSNRQDFNRAGTAGRTDSAAHTTPNCHTGLKIAQLLYSDVRVKWSDVVVKEEKKETKNMKLKHVCVCAWKFEGRSSEGVPVIHS